MPALVHEPIIPPVIGAPVEPVPDEVVATIGRASASDVSDIVGPFYTMSPVIRPLHPQMSPVCGRALTVKAWPGDNLAIHGALALSVQPGDVLVVDWRGFVGACGSGARSIIHAFAQGLRGVVIDGAWRDADDLYNLGFPVYGRALSAFSPSKQRPGEINVPVHCAGVIVSPGDVIVADGEGVAVVPRAFAQAAADVLAGEEPADDGNMDLMRARAEQRRASYIDAFQLRSGLDLR